MKPSAKQKRGQARLPNPETLQPLRDESLKAVQSAIKTQIQ